MKPILCILLLLSNYLYPQTFDVEPIKISGDSDKRINLVFLSDGYQTTELDDFLTDATNFTSTIFNSSPLKEYEPYFNVYAIKVPSNESGADHPATATDIDENGATPEIFDTYFDSTFDAYGIHRLLFYGVDGITAGGAEAKITYVLMDNFPQYDAGIVLVNTNTYGGSGGKFAISYNGFWGAKVALHELGHSLFKLKDEYYPGDIRASEAINMTQETSPELIKWKNWLNIEGVGIYPHGNSGVAATWYKPHQNCIMERVDKSFCPVCTEGIIEKIHDLVSPIDAYFPITNAIDAPDFPIDFQLELIKPEPNTLESSWSLNENPFANGIEMVSVSESDLVIGENTLIAVVHDNSPFLKVDNHDEGSHVFTVEWIINYSTLGIETIESKTNEYNIQLYPNPTSSILNLKFDSQLTRDLSVKISSIDGKVVKTVNISTLTHTPVDISSLSDGIYVAHFYANNSLVFSKRIVKN
ncbi:T9SS type A sorting domain-containing protein [Cognatitamlana onchidii]|uniref:T9SS type A sorting domain-containing protein n=1 Tax=Cognatitamlana onchidii TaxID=2562860 RepID=UPI0010A6581F|nr:M64 family metallopeptidase [Algibacter onchidii]